jgi:hypothetical protein
VVVAVAKAELNNTVHLCSNQGCTCISTCVLAEDVVAMANPNNTVRLLYTWPSATVCLNAKCFLVKTFVRLNLVGILSNSNRNNSCHIPTHPKNKLECQGYWCNP